VIRAVFFDAVGTLIEPHPGAVDVYFDAGRRHGSRLSREEIATRFRNAFCREDEFDRANGWRTDEAREERRWRDIVRFVLDDVSDSDSCFRELWDHFADPQSWRCLDGAEEVLAELERRGYLIGMASNFDGRLRKVAAAKTALRPVRRLVVSSEVGRRKPSREFFEEVVRVSGVGANHILFVGDDPVNDEEGARAAQMRVLLLDSLGGDGKLTSLAELPKWLTS
jgi:putative hydrolase of the HAD superfamily